MSKGLFVTGTGTDVGKTYVTALLLKKLRESGENAAYYKAAMSGNDRGPDGKPLPGDALYAARVSGIAQSTDSMCPYVYETACSPHLASRLEGNPVERAVVRRGFEALAERYDWITVEGSGGILCPLREDGEKLTLEDVLRELSLPSVIVAPAGLGAVNSVGLTAFYMAAKGLPVKGVIFNDFQPGDPICEDNVRMCQALTGLPTLAKVENGATGIAMNVEQVQALYEAIAPRKEERR